MHMENNTIWEEKSYIEQGKNCLKCSELGQKDSINDIRKDSMNKECKDIGKIEKTYYQKNRAERILYQREYDLKNKENKKRYKSEWYQKNKKRCDSRKKKHKNDNINFYIKYNAQYQKTRKENDINFKISCYLRSRLSNAVKNNSKSGSSVRDLGCSIEEFKKYIELKFQDGMTWDNYGKWHLDHITPLSWFDLTKRSQFVIASHYTNYQPLWEIDNLHKWAN